MNVERMQGALGLAVIAALVGLFGPANWHAYAFGVVLLAGVVGAYDSGPWFAAQRSHDLCTRAERLWGKDRSDWPVWECTADGCDQRNAGWVLECGSCGELREVPACADDAAGVPS